MHYGVKAVVRSSSSCRLLNGNARDMVKGSFNGQCVTSNSSKNLSFVIN